MIIACGRDANKPTPYSFPAPQSSDKSIPIVFDGFTERDETLLREDLALLNSLPLGSGDRRVFEVSEFSGPGFTTWLRERFHFFLGTEFDYLSKLPEPEESWHSYQLGYSVAQDIGTLEKTFAMNVGAHLYNVAQRYGGLYQIYIQDRYVTANVPRVGIIAAGNALFRPVATSSAVNSFANRMYRISTLLHEARHSDANTFPHTTCTNGREGTLCDNALNGPNAVEAQFMTYILSICSSCTSQERSGLQLAISEAQDRINQSGSWVDPSPVRGISDAQ